MKISKEIIHLNTVEELSDVPDILFKYRCWTNSSHKKIITNRIVFMSAPFDFEDPLDCKLLKRYDLLTKQEIYQHYENDSRAKNWNWTELQHRKFARNGYKRSPMHNLSEIKNQQERHLANYNDRIGVFCLTVNPLSIPMWKKYGDEQKGFCVGFKAKKLFKYLSGGGKVQYYDELPIIYPNDDFETEHMKQIYSKEMKWKDEEEYRTIKLYRYVASIQDRQIQLPKECYETIIFGLLMDDDSAKSIKEFCQKEELNVTFHKLTNIKGSLELINL